MADNDKGADWLSKEEPIINPYFGESMLSCGEVEKENQLNLVLFKRDEKKQ